MDTRQNTRKNAHTKTTFRSRVSVLLVLFLMAVFVSPVRSAFRHGAAEMTVIATVMALVALLFTGMRYTISGGKLSFSVWRIRGWSVDISDIRSARRSYNLLSSPAASLRRLRLDFKKGARFPFMLISPVRELEFIEKLRATNPDISVDVPERQCRPWRVWDWDF